jgi:glycosyltransferase involved in cell wall biosynthesis
MEVKHVITNFSGRGGAELMLIRLINGMPDHHHTIISLMRCSYQLKQMVNNKNIVFVELNASGVISISLSLFKLSALLIGIRGPVFAWMYHACVITFIASLFNRKIKLFFNIRHSLDSFRTEKLSTKLALCLSAFFSRFVDAVIFCSKRSMTQHGKFGFSSNKSVLIPNGYEIVFPCEKRPNPIPVVGMLGRFHPAKDYNNFFKTVSSARQQGFDFKVVLGGRNIDTDNKELMDIIVRSKFPVNSVSLLGELSNTKKFYSQVDIFMLSSMTESFPNVLVEAMLNKIFVISTDVGDSRLIIDNDELIAPPQDSLSLASILEVALKKTDQERNIFGEDNRFNAIKKYDIKRAVCAYTSLILSAAS